MSTISLQAVGDNDRIERTQKLEKGSVLGGKRWSTVSFTTNDILRAVGQPWQIITDPRHGQTLFARHKCASLA